jgi:DNA polymerase-3 subunit epsilon/ATP-dependent DNA helicase DinG
VPRPFFAAAIATSRAQRRRRNPDLLLLRFDRNADIEWLRTEGVAEPEGTAAAVITLATARRLLSGRLVITLNASQAFDLDNELGGFAELAATYLDELRTTLGLDEIDQTGSDPLTPVAVRSIASVVRSAIARVGEYDTPTLNRAAALATAASWPIGELIQDELDERAAMPIAIRGEFPYGAHELAFLTSRERPEPLRRTGDNASIPEREVIDLLGPGGGFSRVLDRFERRKPQQAMAAAVARTLNDDGWLLVEAGTGTGKSMAYLAPAARFALQRGERVVVSTNTKALQDQLILKDVPDLKRALVAAGEERPLKAAILKGRSNYLCLRRWFAHERQPVLTPHDAELRAKITLWLPLTESGDRAELRLAGDEEAEFGRVSAEGEACQAARCVYQQRNQCFLYRARRNAENAHLVVVNHALLLSDTGEQGGILPEFEHLVIDEAHHLEDQATSQYGTTIPELAIPELVDTFVRTEGPLTAGLLTEAAALLGRVADDERAQRRAAEAGDRLQSALGAANRLKSNAVELFARLRAVCDAAGLQDTGYGRSFRVTPPVRRVPGWTEVEIEFDRLNQRMLDFEDRLRWFLAAVHEQHQDEDELEEQQNPFEDVEIEIGAGIDRGLELSAGLAEFILSPSDERVYWISISANVSRLSVNSAPLHVGQMLRASLLERMQSVVMTSATLTTDDSFAFVKDRLACHEANELELESPFDYRSSAMLYLADDVPEPNQPGYQAVLERTIVELGRALEGRTLVLFTSHAALRATHRAIAPLLAEEGITVLAQRTDGSPRQLIEQFKSASRTMLLGTSTFWEGVDVVGPALSALVIAKLPFAVPTDPVVAARSEQFEQPFVQYSVPQAVLRFKQGFGRLIRSSSDRGICVVLDRRTISKRYGASFVQSLPHCTVRVGPAAEVADAASGWLEH